MEMTLKNTLQTARMSFDARLAAVLVSRPDLDYTEIGREFGVSETIIRRVVKQFSLKPRKRGPKAKGLPNG